MTLSPWLLVLMAIPVLLLGEQMIKRIGPLSRFNIPAPVIGGLLVSLGVLFLSVTGILVIEFQNAVTAPWWTWLVSTEWDWAERPARNVNLPFLVAFFTCIGLNASWELAKKGSVQVVLFLALAATLVLCQNLIGVGLAKLMGISPMLGLMCGSVSMTGGHGTAMGFADVFQEAGLEGAMAIGMAAATLGLVMGGLIGGPVGGKLIKKWKLVSSARKDIHLEDARLGESGIIPDIRALFGYGKQFVFHLLLVMACIKLGTYVSHLMELTNITFPVYLGAMLLGVFIRNAVDFSGKKWIRTEIVDNISSVMLGLFLAIAMMSLNLRELAGAAAPMLIIIFVQITFVAAFAFFITYKVMGRDFDAAVMSGGHCGFALGATPNAVANMKVLVERHGPAPRAFLVLPIVGAFLIDFPNAILVTVFLNILQ